MVVIRKGILSFKGDKPVTKTIVKRSSVVSTFTSASDSDRRKQQADEMKGEGRIVSNGTTIQGMETRFKDEVNVGDVIIVLHPQTLTLEERIVTHIMSQRSLTIHCPFSSDFVSTTEYMVRKESEKLVNAAKKIVCHTSSDMKKEELLDEGEVHVDKASKALTTDEALQNELQKKLDSQEQILTYREKTGTWGYRTVSVKVDKGMSKEDLLDMRTKKVHDKYC